MPTDEEYQKFRKAVIKKLKYLEGLIDDAFTQLNNIDESETKIADEALDRAQRAERAVRRLKKDFEEHDHGEEDA